MVKVNSKSQKGRSMVEMLGVLAIVGVLSVGGVYGYGVAMKKHKANELLHQASMLATTISAQIQSKGELPQSIENFGDAKYGTFKKPEKANDDQFTMQIENMDSAVCEQMEKMAGGMVRQAKCNGTILTLTYNNNLSSDKVAADYNNDEAGCEDSGRKYCLGSNSCIASDKECGCSGTVPACKKCDTETGLFITDDEKEGENCTTSDNKEGTCNTGECVEKIPDYSGIECTDYENNAECGGVGSGWYCQFNPLSCTDSGKGTCQPVNYLGDIMTATAYGEEYMMPLNGTDWWSSQSWCRANDMWPQSLLSVGCGCDSPDNCACNEHTLAIGSAFQEKYPDGDFYMTNWSTDLLDDSCSGAYVDYFGGGVSWFDRDIGGYNVICGQFQLF